MSAARIPAALRDDVRQRAAGRCEYCRMPELGAFFAHEADHVIATQHRGQTELGNLAFACFQSNRIVPLFNPRTDSWSEHFRTEGGRIIPLTAVARATAALLNFDEPDREEARCKLSLAGRYPG